MNYVVSIKHERFGRSCVSIRPSIFQLAAGSRAEAKKLQSCAHHSITLNIRHRIDVTLRQTLLPESATTACFLWQLQDARQWMLPMMPFFLDGHKSTGDALPGVVNLTGKKHGCCGVAGHGFTQCPPASVACVLVHPQNTLVPEKQREFVRNTLQEL